MTHDPSEANADPPFYPSGYTPEIEEADTGYDLMQVRQSQYSGPIPPPESLEYYEQVLPGAADRILTMAEKNAENLRDLRIMDMENERISTSGGLAAIKRGQICGMVAVGLFAGLAGFAIYQKLYGLAFSICTVTVVGVATVFVTGQKYKCQQQSEKDDEDQQ